MAKSAMTKILALFDSSGNGRLSKDELKEFSKRTVMSYKFVFPPY
jgi:hypothetical protein